jgi:hypothetical protein
MDQTRTLRAEKKVVAGSFRKSTTRYARINENQDCQRESILNNSQGSQKPSNRQSRISDDLVGDQAGTITMGQGQKITNFHR